MNEFNNLKTTKKGTIAENYVKDYLIRKGYNVWWNTNEQSTPYDGIANNKQIKGKWSKMLVEVKCKYPTHNNLMSVHCNDLEIYKQTEEEEAKPMCIFFVDPKNKKLYQTNIELITKNYK